MYSCIHNLLSPFTVAFIYVCAYIHIHIHTSLKSNNMSYHLLSHGHIEKNGLILNLDYWVVHI